MHSKVCKGDRCSYDDSILVGEQRFRCSEPANEYGSLCAVCIVFVRNDTDSAENVCVSEIQMCAEFNTQNVWWMKHRHYLCSSMLQVHGLCAACKKKNIWILSCFETMRAALSRLLKLKSNHNNGMCPFWNAKRLTTMFRMRSLNLSQRWNECNSKIVQFQIIIVLSLLLLNDCMQWKMYFSDFEKEHIQI